jgi:hypothetical protein
MKHSKQLEESRAVSQAAVKELEQLQVAMLLSCVQYLVISVPRFNTREIPFKDKSNSPSRHIFQIFSDHHKTNLCNL